jgi:hypothetical protein
VRAKLAAIKMRPCADSQRRLRRWGNGGAQTAMLQPQGRVSSYLNSLRPNTPTTPQEMLQTANSLVDELLGLPGCLKNSELRRLKTYNAGLHGMVRARMDAKRQ